MAIYQVVKALGTRRFGVPRRPAPGALRPGVHPSRCEQSIIHIRPRSVTSRLSGRTSLTGPVCAVQPVSQEARKKVQNIFFFPWLLENEICMVCVKGTSLHTFDQLINPTLSPNSAVSLVTRRVGAPGAPRAAKKAGHHHSSETCTHLLPFSRTNKTY